MLLAILQISSKPSSLKLSIIVKLLLKTFVILGSDHSQLDVHVGPHHDVHQRQQQLAEDLLHENG